MEKETVRKAAGAVLGHGVGVKVSDAAERTGPGLGLGPGCWIAPEPADLLSRPPPAPRPVRPPRAAERGRALTRTRPMHHPRARSPDIPATTGPQAPAPAPQGYRLRARTRAGVPAGPGRRRRTGARPGLLRRG
ncbi:hypothetical protein ACFXAZ_38820 [Streptomyces sp. NPDC059477]|uniref:hypothetical protein n=1 Tax=Streptomyces sp. NPDC059477 TaxID=3346847 RepID=UPI0036BCE595